MVVPKLKKSALPSQKSQVRKVFVLSHFSDCGQCFFLIALSAFVFLSPITMYTTQSQDDGIPRHLPRASKTVLRWMIGS